MSEMRVRVEGEGGASEKLPRVQGEVKYSERGITTISLSLLIEILVEQQQLNESASIRVPNWWFCKQNHLLINEVLTIAHKSIRCSMCRDPTNYFPLQTYYMQKYKIRNDQNIPKNQSDSAKKNKLRSCAKAWLRNNDIPVTNNTEDIVIEMQHIKRDKIKLQRSLKNGNQIK